MSKHLNDYFSVSASGTEETVVICPTNDMIAVCLAGATFPTQIPIGDFATQLCFHIPRSFDQPGHFVVLGLCRRSYNAYGISQEISYHIVPVHWVNDKTAVHLGKVFIPPAERLIHVTSDGAVEVTIDGIIYSSSKADPALLSGRHIGVDANLLCRYVAGFATADEVKASYKAAERVRQEKKAAQKAAQIPWAEVALTIQREWQERKWGWRSRIKQALALLPQ